MAIKVIKRMQDTAEALYKIRQQIDEKEEANKQELASLKLERDAIQALLLADMNKNNLLSLKVKSGDSFYKGSRKGVEITNEAHALAWAIEHRTVSINKVLVAQELKQVDPTQIPFGFKLTETEFISVRKGKETEEDK